MNTAAHPTSPRLLIVVPAHNEAANIQSVLESLARLPLPHDVIVINDGSTDATSDIARRCGADVLEMPCNVGVGGAMQTGYQYAQEHGYDLAVQFDGDGQHCADQVPALLQPVLSGQADMATGSRALGGPGYHFSLDRFIGSRLLAGLVSRLIGCKITDPTSGFRAANRDVIRFFSRHYPQNWLGDTVEALVEVARYGFVVREVPTRMQARRHGRSAVGSFAGFIHTLRIILAVLIDCMEHRFDDDSVRRPPP